MEKIFQSQKKKILKFVQFWFISNRRSPFLFFFLDFFLVISKNKKKKFSFTYPTLCQTRLFFYHIRSFDILSARVTPPGRVRSRSTRLPPAKSALCQRRAGRLSHETTMTTMIITIIIIINIIIHAVRQAIVAVPACE